MKQETLIMSLQWNVLLGNFGPWVQEVLHAYVTLPSSSQLNIVANQATLHMALPVSSSHCQQNNVLHYTTETIQEWFKEQLLELLTWHQNFLAPKFPEPTVIENSQEAPPSWATTPKWFRARNHWTLMEILWPRFSGLNILGIRRETCIILCRWFKCCGWLVYPI